MNEVFFLFQSLLYVACLNYKSSAALMGNPYIGECGKRITAFSKVCKNKSLEADLIMYVPEIPFSMGKEALKHALPLSIIKQYCW